MGQKTPLNNAFDSQVVFTGTVKQYELRDRRMQLIILVLVRFHDAKNLSL